MLLRKIDDFLNGLTMYRLLTYGLCILAAITLALSALGIMSLPIAGMVFSLVILLATCYGVNKALAYVWQITSNSESWLISALILFFILPQATTLLRVAGILLAGILAMASKYLIAYHGKHIFNPAVFAASILGLFGLLNTTWWVGSNVLWPFTLIFGLLVVRKIRRFPLVICFAVISMAISAIMAMAQHVDIGDAVKQAAFASPIIFLGTVMLTEPATMPPRRRQQAIFGAIVGLLYALHWTIGTVFIYPELALLAGNIYAFAVSPKYRLKLRLKEVQKVSDRVYNYVFIPSRKLSFEPGQYLEWTLGANGSGSKHGKTDMRGNRRTFTIASSPTEDTIQLGVKFYEPSSSYKKALKHMEPGDNLYAGQLAGNFVLPQDIAEKLVFIAGGIGITPFRSMLKHLIDTKEKRDITLLYAVPHSEEIAYKDVFKKAAAMGVRVIPIVTGPGKDATWKGRTGRLDKGVITEEVPDFAERTFYLSGPQMMVEDCQSMLQHMGVHRTRIETDYFPGY
jgi:glycine betaine catabolism B